MGSTNKTSLGLNQWVASDKPVRQDFVNDNSIIDDSLSKLNRELTVEDISSKITAINGAVITSKIAKRVQSLCYISFGVMVPADSLLNLSIFSLDSSLLPSIGHEGVAVNTITGVAYAISVGSTIRFSMVKANDNYTRNTELKCQLTWFVK